MQTHKGKPHCDGEASGSLRMQELQNFLEEKLRKGNVPCIREEKHKRCGGNTRKRLLLAPAMLCKAQNKDGLFPVSFPHDSGEKDSRHSQPHEDSGCKLPTQLSPHR